ncbi:MAG: enoyl-CoA hydratase-related protein, partial [Burkholderiales bacterium]
MNPDLHFEMQDHIAVVRLNRPSKRNALNDGLIAALCEVFSQFPEHARAAVLHGSGEHFCAGLDLSELQTRDAGQG